MFLDRKTRAPSRPLDPVLRRQQKEMLMQGINEDLPSSHLPETEYSFGFNVEPADLGMRSVLGHKAAYGTPLFPPEHLVFATSPGLFYWMYASGDGIGVTDGELQFDITPPIPPTSLWADVVWTDTSINDFPVLNNGFDPRPWYWNKVTGDQMQELPGWPLDAVAGSIRAFNKSLIAMNITDPQGDFNNHLLWSNSAEPGSIPDQWDPLPENDAGFTTLSDTRGALIDGQQFRDTFMLFKQHSTYTMTYIGGNFVFAFRKLFSTSGLLSKNCSAEYLGKVVALTDGDLIVSDGQSAQSMIDKKMRAWLFNQIDSDNYQRSFVVPYHSASQVWVCFPEIGEDQCTLALVWDASTNSFGVRELYPSTPHIARGQVGAVTGTIAWETDNESWESDTTIWNQSLFNPTDDALLQADRDETGAPPLSQLYAIGEGTTFNGTPIRSKVERIGLDFGDVLRNKYVTLAILRVTGNAGIKFKFRIGASRDDSGVVAWNPEQEFVLGQDSQGIQVQITGRLIAFSVESVIDQPQWTLEGIEFVYNWSGRF